MSADVHSSYLHKFLDFEQRKERIVWAVEALLPHTHKFDTIACRGVSGLLIASAVATAMDKHIAVVRKPRQDEVAHSYYEVEGPIGCCYVIIDDLVFQGDTVREIKNQMTKHLKATCYGAYVFSGYEKLPIDGIHDIKRIPVDCEIPTPLSSTEAETPEAAVQAA